MIHGTFGPNASPMAVDNALDGGEAYAGAGKFGGGVEALESAEKAVSIGRVKARTVVFDKVSGEAIVIGFAEADGGGRAAGGVLPGIIEEIFDGDAKELRVTGDAEAWLNVPGYLTFGLGGLELAGDRRNDGAEVKGVGTELSTGDA